MTNLSALIRARMKTLLVGPPGIGKTARIAQAAAETDHSLVVIRASLSERVDLGGALVPDVAAGVTRELPLASLHMLQHTAAPTILLLDDLGQAPMDVQAACMRLFDRGYLPENVLIWGATNRPGDKAGVLALCEPLRSRFDLAYAMPTPPQPDTSGKAKQAETTAQMLSSWRDELEAWCDWALGRKAPPEVVAWHRATNGRTLYQWAPVADPAIRMPDYRAWETVIRLHESGLSDMQTVAAAIGAPVAIEYCAFAALTNKLPSIASIEADPAGSPVPDDPSALWLAATALGSALTPDNCAPLIQYIGRLPRVYAALAVRDAARREGASLARTPAWSQWFVKNQELFK